MFESSVVPTAPKGRRSALLSISTALQLGLIAAAVIIPMAHVSAQPPVKLVPRPPMPRLDHVKLVPMDESVRRTAMAAGARVQVIRAPTRVPDKPAARIFDDVGAMPDGFLPGGDSSGVPGLSPTVDLGQRSVAPPPQAPKPQPQVQKPTTPMRLAVGGRVRQPKLIREVRPVYPPLARQARMQGVVKITAIVSRDGSVQSLQVVSGHPLLVAAAMDAVRQWLYEPTLLNGEPVEVVLVVDVNFRLSN
jgi:periplasmic protein TonB